ncbi:MAG: hypothetical protein ACRC2R_14005 [Xenococcaceae cyanobacterium]
MLSKGYLVIRYFSRDKAGKSEVSSDLFTRRAIYEDAISVGDSRAVRLVSSEIKAVRRVSTLQIA